jgi:hypothetical protein
MKHTNRGKWSQPGVPHKGWDCIETYDAEDNMIECQMCESTEVRFVHVMTHRNYSEDLHVGCVCAENMANDYIGPRLRERELLNVAKRRNGWLRRKWKTSHKGVIYLNTDGFHIALFRNERTGNYSGQIVHQATQFKQRAQKSYRTLDDAKRASFNGLLAMKKNHPWEAPCQ